MKSVPKWEDDLEGWRYFKIVNIEPEIENGFFFMDPQHTLMAIKACNRLLGCLIVLGRILFRFSVSRGL